eukprot:SAG25_NODE_741_length_5606_cov_2.118576_4_plen_160_part_00
MAHLHTLRIKPQIYTMLCEGDESHPFYIYVGATEDVSKRWSQHVMAYAAYHSGDNDGWSTPKFTRIHHRPLAIIELQFVDDCAIAERDTFLKWYHLLGQSKTQVRGSDWCNADRALLPTDAKRHGPTLQFAYDSWLHRGKATALEGKEDAFLALARLYV